ncbi:MAG TPA: Gfo/Idh/MocA family oxidoreductase [Propionibacteriaceae bacterium]|nr:Gfo/Idh/MocA family oxidoreductase [Propionibacteriaceae bacterium]HPZ49494.1 Gfo/Idh/MocA family oxidoreductase [Propionibacteriaceae bacterium]HQE32585.1 Gfo/Idh/MocA family oxidoreductase [Propionibacteriaceae bacterium]
MTNPRVMLIGAGTMGAHHARVTASSPRVELAVVVDPDERVGRGLAEQYGASWAPEATFTGIDAVIVAAVTDAHAHVASAVLDARLPMLLEKPVATDIAITRDIVAASQRAGTPLMCGFVERFNPAVITARALLKDPVYLTAQRHSPYARRMRTGVAWDLLIHDVDLAIQILGSEPTSVQSVLGEFSSQSAPGEEDVADAILGFGSGAVATVSAARIGQRKVRTMVIHEEDRLVELDLLRRSIAIHWSVSEQLVDGGRGYRQQSIIEIPDLATSQEPLAAQLDRFIDLIDGRADLDQERDGLLVPHEVIERVRKGYVSTLLPVRHERPA